MIKYLLILLLPILGSANLNYTSDQTKNVEILDSFDIDPTFLHDKTMSEIKHSNIAIYKKEKFLKTMDDAYLFIPEVKSILAKNSVPPEFIYLAMAESYFSPRAHSTKKASGFWQFMPETGRLFGLKINKKVDERRDFVKSTEAASKYLTKLHDKFGKWYLAALAYNCGDGRLSKAIKEAKSDELSVLLDPDKKYLPKESRMYLRKVITLAMMGNDEQFLLKNEYEHILNRANAYSVSTVQVKSGESLAKVAELIEMPLEELQKLNRHIVDDTVPAEEESYAVYIPYIKLADFQQKYLNAQAPQVVETASNTPALEPKSAPEVIIHTVVSGDTLYSIARVYGVSLDEIISINGLSNNKLSLHQKLLIPQKSQEKSKMAVSSL